MAQKKKSKKPSSAKGKSPSASPGKKKLGNASLDWIKDTTEGKAILPEQAEILRRKAAGVSKETKIGVGKKYVSEEAEKKEKDIKEVPPGFSAVSSTITKGKKVTPVEQKGAEKAEVLEKKETAAVQEGPPVSTEPVKAITKEEEVTPVEQKGAEKAEVLEKKETAAVQEGPPVSAEPVKAAEEKERITAEEVEKNLRGIRGAAAEEKKIPPQYEIAEKEITEKVGAKIEESAAHIPDDTSTIVKKKTKAASQEAIKRRKVKTPSKKKEKVAAAAAVAKEEMPPPVKRKWMDISGVGESLKKGSQKVSEAIVKPLKSVDKTRFKESMSAAFNVSKQPVKAISAVDRKITRSVKKVVMSRDLGVSGKSVLNNIKSTDARITKTAKKLIDSISK